MWKISLLGNDYRSAMHWPYSHSKVIVHMFKSLICYSQLTGVIDGSIQNECPTLAGYLKSTIKWRTSLINRDRGWARIASWLIFAFHHHVIKLQETWNVIVTLNRMFIVVVVCCGVDANFGVQYLYLLSKLITIIARTSLKMSRDIQSTVKKIVTNALFVK